jgi:hypothetical protein
MLAILATIVLAYTVEHSPYGRFVHVSDLKAQSIARNHIINVLEFLS